MDGSLPAVARRLAGILLIQEDVARAFGVTVGELVGQQRNAVVTRPRQIAMYLSSELTAASSVAIGRRFGNRDHTTVLHAIRVVRERTRADATLAERVRQLRTGLVARFAAEREASAARSLASIAKAPRSAVKHFKKLADDDPDALAGIVAAAATVLCEASGIPIGTGAPPAPTSIADDVRFLRSRGIVVHRDLDHPERPVWVVDGKGAMGRDAVAAYAARLRHNLRAEGGRRDGFR